MFAKTKVYVIGGALLTLGIVIGGVIQHDRPALSGLPEDQPATAIIAASTSSPSPSEQRIYELEAQLAELRSRLERLETSTFQAAVTADAIRSDNPELQNPPINESTTNIAQTGLEGLIAAGVDSFRAEEIMQMDSRLQLQRLEIQDRARREGYIGSEKYRQQMRQLRKEQDLRNELDDDTYDRYLFHTGRPNRIRVDSVLLGSAAENVGIRAGDILLNYEDKRLYNWNDLQRETTAGERGETVSLIVLRDGNEMMLSLPRGPVGVQLSSVSRDPSG